MDLATGFALLVDSRGSSASVKQRLPAGELGTVLMSSRPRFDVQFVDGDRDVSVSGTTIEQHLTAFGRSTAAAALLVLTGHVIEIDDEPALIIADDWRAEPTVRTIPLRHLSTVLREARPHTVAAVLAIEAQPDTQTPLDAAYARRLVEILATSAQHRLVVVHDYSLLPTLYQGLRGQALDPATGTVTLASLSRYLTRSIPDVALDCTSHEDTLLTPPSHTLTLPHSPHLASQRSADTPVPSLVGEVLPGRFQVIREIARGGFGVVYLARQLTIGREVAVKVLQQDVPPGSEEERFFVREIEAIGRLTHPNIVRILQADTTLDGRWFFAMELIPGPSLEQLLQREGPLPAARAIALTADILAALGAAHNAGVVHADIKPANIMVVPADSHIAQIERAVLLDFGQARLKSHVLDEASVKEPGADEACGGTPAYMAPEQLYHGRVDARSDIFATALVLHQMLTGWRRQSLRDLTPPLDAVTEPNLRAALAQALSIDPSERVASAAAFAAALTGQGAPPEPAPPPPPFSLNVALDEHTPLCGRDRALAALVEAVLFRPVVVYTGESRVGVTSVVRAGLVPRLRELGITTQYLSCRTSSDEQVRDAMATAEAHSLAEVRPAVLILDQLDGLHGDRSSESAGREILDLVHDLLRARERATLVLCVCEEHLASLDVRSHDVDATIVYLGPLTRAEAREVLTVPLAGVRVAMDAALSEQLLDDLEAAGSALASALGWDTSTSTVYPPHTQIVGAALYKSLPPGDGTLTLADYERLGCLPGIFAHHLTRVLRSALAARDTDATRTLLLDLVTTTRRDEPATEEALIAAQRARHPDTSAHTMLEVLRAWDVLIPTRSPSGEPSWMLTHASLAEPIADWANHHDSRRNQLRATLRYHLRRSTTAQPNVLGRAELQELTRYPALVDELEREWAQKLEHSASDPAKQWTPRRLIAHSRRVRIQRRVAIAGVVTVALALIAIVTGGWYQQRTLREYDLGRVELVLAPFDRDPKTGATRPVAPDTLPGLTWQLYDPNPDDPTVPGVTVAVDLVRVGSTRLDANGHSRTALVDVRGGPAFLRITGRGRDQRDCPPSWIPLRQLPGYAKREQTPPTLRIRVPTCQASMAGMREIPAGEFVHDGPGEPPTSFAAYVGDETMRHLDAFWIDATEVTNHDFAVFAEMSEFTGRGMPPYPTESPVLHLRHIAAPERPVTFLDWYQATDYCRFLGKRVPTSAQWEKAARGGIFLDAAQTRRNPLPRRNLPWGLPTSYQGRANVANANGAAAVGNYPTGASPYGVLDMAGNVYEWTRSPVPTHGTRAKFTRGGSWASPPHLEHYTIAYQNNRDARRAEYDLGVRCVLEPTVP